MFFTREDILKIQQALLQLGVKDSELPSTEYVTYDDTLSIIQDGKNKKIEVKDFFNQISLWKKEDFLNITDKYDKHYISLRDAINLVPVLQRKDGLVITFQDTNGDWRIYQFRGNITEFLNKEKWFDLYDYRNYIVQSIVPDEEDLTASIPNENGNSLVYLKDRVYNPTIFNGKGYKFVRKNIINVELATIKISVINPTTLEGDIYFNINNKDTKVHLSPTIHNTTKLVAEAIKDTLTTAYNDYKVTVANSVVTLTHKYSGNTSPTTFEMYNTGVRVIVEDYTTISERNIITQEDINKADTIYEIRYNFDLDGKIITIPKNCVLYFTSGKFYNGSINMDNTIVSTLYEDILSEVNISGNYYNIQKHIKDHQRQLDDKQSQIDDKQQQITANDEDISLLQTRSTQMEETIKSIAATGGASQAIAVTYNNDASRLNAINAQDAIDEVSSIVIYDVSVRNNGAVFESLSALLSSSNLSTLIPTSVRHGGMSIRFVQSSDNKYVQYRLMANQWSTTVSDWQGVDDEPTVGSDNLVKSEGIISFVEDKIGSYDFSNNEAREYYATDIVGPAHNEYRSKTTKINVVEGDIIITNAASDYGNNSVYTICALYNGELQVSSSVIYQTIEKRTYTVPSGVNQIIVVGFRENANEFYAYKKEGIKYTGIENQNNIAILENNIAILENNITNVDLELSELDFSTDASRPYYYDDNGTPRVSYNADRIRTKAVEVNVGDKLSINWNDTPYSYRIAALDENMTIVPSASLLGHSSNNLANFVYTVPSGIKYLIFALQNVGNPKVVKFGGTFDSIHKDIFNVYNFIHDNIAIAYRDAIKELFIKPELFNLCDEIIFMAPSGTNPANSISIIGLSGAFNNPIEKFISRLYFREGETQLYNDAIIELKCTVSNVEGVSIGDVLGYVIFQDINLARHYSFGSYAYWLSLNKDNVTDLTLTPTIYNYLLGKKKFVYQSTEINGYEKGISEFYVRPELFGLCTRLLFTAPSGTNPANSIYLHGYNGSNRVFGCRYYFSDVQIKNNTVVELICNESSISGVNIGDTLGYIVFSNVDLVINNSTGSDQSIFSLNKEVVGNIKNSPTIYSYIQFKEETEANSDIEIVLPDKIYAVEDDTLQLFHKTVVKAANPYIYNIQIECSYGTVYKRYYEFRPIAEQVGTNRPLTYKVTDNNNNILASKSVTLYVLPKMTSPSTNKNILVLGDSLTAYGQMLGEFNRRVKLTSGDGTPANPKGLGLTNITFVGRKELNGLHFEATGGYSWYTYATDSFKSIRYYVNGINRLNKGDRYKITNANVPEGYATAFYMQIEEINVSSGEGNILCSVYGGYTYPDGSIPASGTLERLMGDGDSVINYSSYLIEPGSPFFNKTTNKLDFIAYSNNYLDGAPIDVIMTNMGGNAMFSMAELADNIRLIKDFMRQYHIDYPNGKFVINTRNLLNAKGPFLGQEWYNVCMISAKYCNELKKIVDSSEFSSYVSIMNMGAEFDCEWSYGIREANVNNRMTSEKEFIGNEQYHPTNAGYYQLADSFYRALTALNLQ